MFLVFIIYRSLFNYFIGGDTGDQTCVNVEPELQPGLDQ